MLSSLTLALLVAAPQIFPGPSGAEWRVHHEQSVWRIELVKGGVATAAGRFEDTPVRTHRPRAEPGGALFIDERRVELQPGTPATLEKTIEVTHTWDGKAFVAGPETTRKAQLYLSASGQRWRVTRTAGTVPESGYEQSYQRLDRLGADGAILSWVNFEERAWVRADGVERVWVEFSLDERGELQAKQHARTEPKDKAQPATETTTLYRWNGKGFDRTVLPVGR